MSTHTETIEAQRRACDSKCYNAEHLITPDALAALLRERDELRKEVAITRQIQHDLSIAFKTGNPSATELHHAQYAIADLRERAMRAEQERDQWKQQWQTVTDERAASFRRIGKAAGGTSLTEYQPEIDLEIEAIVKALVHSRDQWRECAEDGAAIARSLCGLCNAYVHGDEQPTEGRVRAEWDSLRAHIARFDALKAMEDKP